MKDNEEKITTTCKICGDIIILEEKYGWTETDQDINNVICDTCNEEN